MYAQGRRAAIHVIPTNLIFRRQLRNVGSDPMPRTINSVNVSNAKTYVRIEYDMRRSIPRYLPGEWVCVMASAWVIHSRVETAGPASSPREVLLSWSRCRGFWLNWPCATID